MADKTLGKVYFLLGRNTQNDAERQVDDPVGYFSCKGHTARFLDITGLGSPGVVVRERKGGERTIVLADGTNLNGQEGANTVITVAKSKIVLPVSAKGSRTATLQTGKQITSTKRTKNKTSAFHTISFRFPSWATILTISDALAELIPENKISGTPSAQQIFPVFKMQGGKRYPIMKKSEATTNLTAKVGVTSADLNALAQQSDSEVIEGAD